MENGLFLEQSIQQNNKAKGQFGYDKTYSSNSNIRADGGIINMKRVDIPRMKMLSIEYKFISL